jgi:hypothetical protein
MWLCCRQQTWISALRDDGLDALKETYDVNGVKSTISPFQARGSKESYIYKHEKYAHLREGKQQWDSSKRTDRGSGSARRDEQLEGEMGTPASSSTSTAV